MTKSFHKFECLLALVAALPLAAAGFRASAVKVDITPDTSQWLNGYDPRQSAGVHDRIYHRIVAMDDGTTQFYLISSDLCLFSPSVYDETAERLTRELNIPAGHVWWSVTHTHSAPEVGAPGMYRALLGRSNHEWSREYAARVIDALVEGVKSARSRLEPASIGIGTGMSMANINRRAKDVDGTVTLGLNPDGSADRQIGVLRFERSDGSLIAVVANYAMHGTVLSGKNLLISGDAPGVVAAYVEEKTGAPMLYVNGAAGNLAPIYSVYPDPVSGHLGQFRVLLGDRILAALRSIGPGTNQVTLSVGEKIVDTPRRPGLIWPEELAGYSAQAGNGSPLVRLPVRFLKINNTLIWSAPIELFCEIAMAIRNQSPFSYTFYFGYTNGWLGYLPTKTAFGEGGYEPKTSPFSEAAEHDLIAGVLAYLGGQSARAK
ncbi:MAG: neutral/alkaline non-lysosomal ceramidase N-terminal domain-containing protein [Bryobacteraceae bacterium]